MEHHEENPRDEEEEHEEHQDAREGNGEQRSMLMSVDFTTVTPGIVRILLRSVPIRASVLPPTNATHYDLKPHVIQMLPSFLRLRSRKPLLAC
jgi:hypothetical protein